MLDAKTKEDRRSCIQSLKQDQVCSTVLSQKDLTMANECCCQCRGCCVFPHGIQGMIAILLTCLSYFFVVFASNYCKFVTSKPSDPLLSGGGFEREFGLFSFENLDGDCEAYHENDLGEDLADLGGSAFDAARAFGALANFFAGLTFLFMLIGTCMSYNSLCLKGWAGCMLLAFVFESLTFVMFASDFCHDGLKCDFGPAAGMAIGGLLMCLITAGYLAQMKGVDGNDDEDAAAPAAAEEKNVEEPAKEGEGGNGSDAEEQQE